MARLTSDPADPAIARGVDTGPTPQSEAYLVLSEEERAKGFVRPLRDTYRHVGIRPTHPTRELTADEHARYDEFAYILHEDYPIVEGDRASAGSGRRRSSRPGAAPSR